MLSIGLYLIFHQKSGSVCLCLLLFAPAPSLSSCQEKVTMALDFEMNPHPLSSCNFQVFWLFLWLLTTKFAACSKPPSRDNHRKASYPRT